MAQDWVRGLKAARIVRPVSSIAVRQRGIDTVGPAATEWAVDVGERMATHILDVLVDWPGDRSELEVESLRRAAETSTIDTLCVLVTGDVDTLARSREPLENIAFYVSHGFSLKEAVRNAHSGQAYMLQELIDRVGELVPEDERMDALRETTRLVQTSWTRHIDSLSAEYLRESERWRASLEGIRTQRIRRLVEGGSVDEARASSELGYDLARTHVGVVVWLDIDDVDTARLFNYAEFARELATATGSVHAPLVHRTASTYAEVWIGAPTKPVCEAFRDRTRPASLRIAAGRPAAGQAGFRETALQARSTYRLVRRAASLGPCVTYDEVELVALLSADLEGARSFVRRQLGPLAADDDRSAELRKTLAAWLDEGRSVGAAAKLLYMHRNSVAYRIKQALELLGDDIDPLEFRCALALAEALPDDSLGPPREA